MKERNGQSRGDDRAYGPSRWVDSDAPCGNAESTRGWTRLWRGDRKLEEAWLAAGRLEEEKRVSVDK